MGLYEPQSGIEMMLRRMGLASVLDAAKQLAESGAVQKIIQFADDAEELRNEIADIKRQQGEILALLAGRQDPGVIEGPPRLLQAPTDNGGDVRTAADEPRPRTRKRGASGG